MSTVKLKRSAVPGKVPTAGALELGEVAINTHDGKMYLKQDANGAISVVEVGKPGIAENVFYVSKSGNDSNSGDTIADAFLTIDQALSGATSGDTIFIKSGVYTLNNNSGGVTIPAGVSLVGDNLRTTKIQGSASDNDMFYVNNASYITGVTFIGHTNGAAAVSFNPDGSAGSITTSPYVENCSSITTTGTGMYIDGDVVSGLRSMVVDSYTQINAGGKGIHLINRGYAQLVSVFTVSCDVGILCEDGGQCSLTNSNCSFGNFGLKATGSSGTLYTATLDADTSAFGETFLITSAAQKPNYGDAFLISGSSKYFTVDQVVTENAVTGEYTVTPLETIEEGVTSGTSVTFVQRSAIAASSITFEYVGTGTGLYDTPATGAFPIQTQEVVQDANREGQVFFTSTDQVGNFRIGGDLLINRVDGTIEGETFDRSLFNVMTPYILALEGN